MQLFDSIKPLCEILKFNKILTTHNIIHQNFNYFSSIKQIGNGKNDKINDKEKNLPI